MADEESFRDTTTSEERNYEPILGIDPGFVNYRRLLPYIAGAERSAIDLRNSTVRASSPEPLRAVATAHDYVAAALRVAAQRSAVPCAVLAVGPLPAVGTLVSSTDEVKGSPRVRRDVRIKLEVALPIAGLRKVFLELSTAMITSDTTRMELASRRSTISFVGVVERVSPAEVVVAPLVLGGPWLHPGAEPEIGVIFFGAYDHFENFVDDIDEFSQVRTVPREESSAAWQVMENVSERAVKTAICQLLHEPAVADWGGETSDHFSSGLHLSGRRVSAAFLLKGPSAFCEMKARHLGKNGDQIYRLAQQPAQMLVVQHSHLVSPPVRATLRAFAVSPGQPRRYCIIDGPDTYRLLKAHGLIEGAIRDSKPKKRGRTAS